MKRITLVWLPATWLLAATLFLSACDNTSGILDKEILPPDDLIGMAFTDTLGIELETQIGERVNTYRAGRQLFGNYVDPLFGRLSATTYTEVLPRSSLNFGAAEDLKFDSLVLKLEVESAYGRLDQVQTLRVHQLTEALPDTSEIYSDQSLSYAAEDLSGGFPIDYSNTGSRIYQVRLDDELGKAILFADPAILGDKDQFRDLLKGLALTTDPVKFLTREPGGIFTLFASSDSTFLELHYRRRDSVNGPFEVQEPEPFKITPSTPRFHQVVRSEVDDKLLGLAMANPDQREYAFLQGGNLVRTLVRFPALDQFPPVAVSRAELVFSVDPEWLGSEKRFSPPFQMVPIQADAQGDVVLNEDGIPLLAETLTAAVQFDEDNNQIVVPLTGYIQRVTTGDLENHGFLLMPDNAPFVVNRVVMGGTEHPTLKPILRLTYSTLPR